MTMTMTKTDNFFSDSLKRGELGEEIFLSSFAGMNDVKKVYDTRGSARHQDMDVDFVIDFWHESKLAGSTRIAVELKTDFTLYQNVYYEKYSCYEMRTAGCMEKTKSDFLVYYYIRKKLYYILKTDSFRAWVHEHSEDFIKNFKPERGRDGVYHKAGLLIPTSSIEAAFESKQIIGKKVQVSDAFSKKRLALLDKTSYGKIEVLHEARKIRNAFDDM